MSASIRSEQAAAQSSNCDSTNGAAHCHISESEKQMHFVSPQYLLRLQSEKYNNVQPIMSLTNTALQQAVLMHQKKQKNQILQVTNHKDKRPLASSYEVK